MNILVIINKLLVYKKKNLVYRFVISYNIDMNYGYNDYVIL